MSADKFITLAHGNGGRLTRELIEDLFAHYLANPGLDVDADAAQFTVTPDHSPLVTTDSFIVQPLEFPGGDIGTLAINGTVNDLAVSGATPRFIALSALIEEGFECATLERITASLARAAEQAGVRVIAGDTKVLPRGHGGGLYLTTTGIGERPERCRLGLEQVRAGDAVLVSGTVGDHGICVLLARNDFDLTGDVVSDCAPVTKLTATLRDWPGVRFMRDPTRGGIGEVAWEIARGSGCDVRLEEAAVPIADPVASVCEMLGYDPYHLASEGRVIAIVAADVADEALAAWQALPEGAGAAIIGRVEKGSGRVRLATAIGGERLIEPLEDDPLPRIC